jgi:hypothetical protein
MEETMCFIVLYLIIGFLKATRDIILFRFTWSIFSEWPQWIRNFLTGLNRSCRICDGFHLADGLIVQLPAMGILILLNVFIYGISQWWVLPQWVVFFVLFYNGWFNNLYHYILMKKQYRGKAGHGLRE